MKGLTLMHWSWRGVPMGKKIKGGALVIGLAWAFSTALAACVLMCSWVVLSAGPVYNFSTFIAASSILGAVVGGAASANQAGSPGFLHGLLTGLLYGFVIIALLALGSGEIFSFSGAAAREAFFGAAGAAGGICGVNYRLIKLRHQKRKVF